MSVLDFAAHTLDYFVRGQGYENEDGDYIKGEDSWVEDYAKCDIVPAGKANTITTTDGQIEPYSYTIYNLPVTCRKFNYGDKVRIKLYGSPDDVREFIVKGFHRYQMQCKMWV